MKYITRLFPVFILLFLTVIIFRQYVFFGKVPFAGNLLVSFYEPWQSYPQPHYPNGPANKPIAFDSLRIFYPLRSLTIDSLRRLQLPLWNPYDFAGNTQLATYQSAVFFPLTPLFLFLPQIDAWSLIVFLEPFLASVCTYAFLRALSLSKKASLIGALAFGFSGGILVLSEESFMAVYSLLVLPLLLLGIYKYLLHGKFRWFSLFVGAALWSIVSGWFQSTLYVMVFSFVWFLFLSFKIKNLKRSAVLLLGFLISLLLAGPHLLPNIESYLYSARGTTDAKFLFDTYLLPPWQLITYIAPDFFGNPGSYSYFGNGFYYEKIMYLGTVGLFLGLFAVFSIKKSAEEWFFTLSWLLTVSLGLALPTSWLLLYYLHIPLISTILPSRIFLISSFCLAVLAAFGSESLLKKPSKFAYSVASFILIGAVVAVWRFLFLQKEIEPLGHYATISIRNMVLPTIFTASTLFCGGMLLFRQITMKIVGYIFLILIAVVSIVYFSDKYLFFSEKQFTFPPTPVTSQLSRLAANNRIWSFGTGYMERNFATYFHLQSPEGYDSFYIRTYGELVRASQNGGKFTTDIPRADAQLTGVSRLSEIVANTSLLKMLNVLGVKYIFAKSTDEDTAFLSTDLQKTFEKVWSDNSYVIYKNTEAFPRVFFVDSYRIIADPAARLKAFFDRNTDLAKTALLNKDPGIIKTPSELHASAVIKEYRPEKVIIQADTNKQALLVLSDNMYPGWNVYIDGKKGTIFTADHTLRSVVIPTGRHTIIFLFQPQSLSLGILAAAVGVLLFALVGFTITKYRKNS